MKGRFAGTGLCGHKNLELNIIGVRLELVMKQVIQTRDWRKCDGWKLGRRVRGKKPQSKSHSGKVSRGETEVCW